MEEEMIGGGGGYSWACNVTDRGNADLSFSMGRRGRGGEAMGGEAESGGLKKGRSVGSRWAISSSFGSVSNRMRETNPEGN
jgi:hypothetical protein